MGFLRQHRDRLTYPSTARAAARTTLQTDNNPAGDFCHRWHSGHRAKRDVRACSERSSRDPFSGRLDDWYLTLKVNGEGGPSQ